MTSRNRPASRPKQGSVRAAAHKVELGPQNKVCDEMLNTVNDIVNRPPTIANEFRSMDMKLHLVLKSLMEKNSESARGAAKACKIPLSTFSGYLKPGKRQVDPNHLIAIAKHYGVTLDYLFGSSQNLKFDKLPTKKLFSKWVKLTIEDFADSDSSFDLEKLDGDK